MVINHLLSGMILQVSYRSVAQMGCLLLFFSFRPPENPPDFFEKNSSLWKYQIDRTGWTKTGHWILFLEDIQLWMIPSTENKHKWWMGRCNKWDHEGPWLCLPQDQKAKSLQHEKSSTFSGGKFADSTCDGLLFGGESEGSHLVTYNFCSIHSLLFAKQVYA